MITLHKCAICKKQFSIFSMPGYVYRRNGKLFCGWNCMRAYDKKGVEPKRMAAKISTEQKQEAVKVALGGGDPVEYFRGLGSRDPQALWYTTRRALKTSDPAKHARLIAIAKGEAQAEEPATDEPEKAEEPASDEPKEYKTLTPIIRAGMTACGWKGVYGKYCWDEKHEFLDFFGNDGDDISMKLEDWRKFLLELKTAAELLGVEL